jgi:hypothetical protein
MDYYRVEVVEVEHMLYDVLVESFVNTNYQKLYPDGHAVGVAVVVDVVVVVVVVGDEEEGEGVLLD